MINKAFIARRFTTIVGVAILTGYTFNLAVADSSGANKVDYTTLSAAELAEHLIFETNSYNLEQELQEGGTARDRMEQDDAQKACSVVGGGKPDAAALAAISAAARESIVYPEGGIKLGDWSKGFTLAWSGFGFRIAHNYDNHANREPGGNCYNCHMLAPEREIASGTVGPSLTGFGNTRGTDEATLKYVYDIIYNAYAYFPCTTMPRMGAKGVLTHEQIADLMAYVLHPDSPVNQ